MTNDGAVAITTITPSDAKALLATGRNVRTISTRKVNHYARAMMAGKWILNGETIIVGSDGVLLNGFHRLTACVKAGVPFTTYVSRGVQNTPDVRGSIDDAPGRTQAQKLLVRGNWKSKFPASACGGVRWYLSLRNGTVDRDCYGGGVRTSLSSNEISCMAESMPLIRECVDLYSGKESWRIKKLLKPMAPFVGLYAYLGEIEHKLAFELFTAIKGGDVSVDHPAWLLSEYLAKNMMQYRPDTPMLMLAKFIKCWNGIRTGVPVKVLRLMRRESFPSAV